MCHPAAYEAWRDARELYAVNPVRHATRIGHDCREALAHFATDLVSHIDGGVDGGTVAKVRAAIRSADVLSSRVRAQLDALVRYWGTVSDLAQRQEHGATREKESLTGEDARRMVFQTMLVMYELDRTLRLAHNPRAQM